MRQSLSQLWLRRVLLQQPSGKRVGSGVSQTGKQICPSGRLQKPRNRGNAFDIKNKLQETNDNKAASSVAQPLVVAFRCGVSHGAERSACMRDAARPCRGERRESAVISFTLSFLCQFCSFKFRGLLIVALLLLVCVTCPVSVSVRLACSADQIYEGPGTPLPFRAVALLLAAAAGCIGVDGASCGKSIHRVSR